MKTSQKAKLRTVFFDGRCPFCIRWVQFLLDRDGNNCLRFAALQSEWSRKFFERKGLEHPGTGSILVWDGQRLFRQSGAIAELGASLPGVWNLMKHLSILPRKLRDGVYSFIGDRRHQWFGQREACWLPSTSERAKFLDLEDPVYQHPNHGSPAEDHSRPDQG